MSVVPISSPHEANDYVVVVYQNVMIQRIRGAMLDYYRREAAASPYARARAASRSSGALIGRKREATGKFS